MTNTSGKFSAQAAARILNFFEEYLDYPYQLNKMDSVAIPDFAAGAMENWGLNTYRTNYIVWLEEENTRYERWRSAAGKQACIKKYLKAVFLFENLPRLSYIF